MALPVPKVGESDADDRQASDREARECLFRPGRRPDGELTLEQLPLTLDVLLRPREDDQVTQSDPHRKELYPLTDMLERFLERQEDVAVMSDLLIRWEKLGGRDLAPDVFVVKGLKDRGAIDRSFDPATAGVGPCLVVEVVSSSSRSLQDKDEIWNPPLYEKMKVEDLVLLYPPRSGESLRLDVRRLDSAGRYQANPPGPEGWIRLRSVGLRIKVDETGRKLIVEDVLTGERLLSSVEEEVARREAQQRAEQESRRAARESQRAERESRRAARESQRAEHAEEVLRHHVRDLCALLDIGWTPERHAQVEALDPEGLQKLWDDLMSRKQWP